MVDKAAVDKAAIDNRHGIWRMAGMALLLLLSGAVLSGCAIDAATTVVEERKFSNVIDDTEIKANVIKRLLTPTNNDLFLDVSTDVYEGRVMLTGSVYVARDKERAEALVRDLRGVTMIYNEI